jgi:tetratricopeptide (TPR) repeat protein
MRQDSSGHALTTDSGEAAAAFDRAVASYVAWRTDTMTHIQAATDADPDFALPYAARGILTIGLRKPELRAPADEMLAAARAARTPETERERRYIAALDAAIGGRITEAVTHYEAIARAHPHDLFALRLSQFELFWIGEVAWMRDISERAAPAWNDRDQGLGAYLAVRAFGLEENGAYAEAERCGRKAIELEPQDPWGAHAVAHVFFMQGRLREGIEWCSSLSASVLDILLPACRNLWQMGGSHAQRDLFFQLLVDSAHRLGRNDVLSLLFEEMRSVGLEHLEERSSYADALATLH